MPFSCEWSGELDIDRLGNIIPIIDNLNRTRGNKSISKYKKHDKSDFIQCINKIIPKIDSYNEIISHDSRIPVVISNTKYNKLCKKNEQEYLNNFLECLYHN